MGRGAGWRERKLAEAGSGTKNNESMEEALAGMRSTRNRRSVWTIASEPYKGAHFATFPRALIEPCILAGCPAGGTVLDIFFGSGTTGQVAQSLGRNFIGIELNAANEPLQADRLRQPSLLLEAA
jgi:DNA modification methylase